MSNLQLGLRFRIERGLRLVMGAQVKALPEGWSEFEKHEPRKTENKGRTQ